jgi:hypothetical protein
MASTGFSEPSPRLLYHRAPAKNACCALNLRGKKLLYDPADPRPKRHRQAEPKRPRGFQIDHPLDVPRLLDRQVAGFVPFRILSKYVAG